MRLAELLVQEKKAILERCISLTLETYPQETTRFLRDEKDPFVQPDRTHADPRTGKDLQMASYRVLTWKSWKRRSTPSSGYRLFRSSPHPRRWRFCQC